LQFSFEQSAGHGAELRQLGAPLAWTDEAQPADVLAPLVRAAALNARRIALAEPQTPGRPRKPVPARAKPSRKAISKGPTPPSVA